MTDLITPIEILRPAIVEFGPGTAPKAGAFAEARGLRRTLVVADAFNADRVDLLRLPGTVSVFGRVVPEPDTANLADAVAAADAFRPDLVVGFGGGSAMDLAKLVAVLHKSEQSLADIVGPERVQARQVALVQVPTTAGTGSEAGTRALVTDPRTSAKLAVQSRFMLADLAAVDPDLTLTVPRHVTAETGIDALAHCVEAYTNRKAHPLVDIHALEGAALVGRYLARAVADGSDREARAGLALASLYGGYCLGPVNTAGGHAVAYPLGTRHHVSHGAANAVIFPPCAGLQRPGRAGTDGGGADGAGTAGVERARAGLRRGLSLLHRPRHRDAHVPARRARGRSRRDGRRGLRHPAPARQQPARPRARRHPGPLPGRLLSLRALTNDTNDARIPRGGLSGANRN